MVIHMVVLKVKKRVAPAKLAAVMKQVGAMKRKVPGIVAFSWGPYASPEGLNRGYTHGFCTTFKDVKSRDGYLGHPEHRKVVVAILKILEGGIDGVLAFDYEASTGEPIARVSRR